MTTRRLTLNTYAHPLLATAVAGLALVLACTDGETGSDSGSATTSVTSDASSTSTTDAATSAATDTTSDGSTSDDATSDDATSDDATSDDATSDGSTSDGSTTGECSPSEDGVKVPYFGTIEGGLSPFGKVACEVTDAGFQCADSDELFEVDAIFDELAPLPWDIGQQVLLHFDFYAGVGGELVVRAEDDSLLAVLHHQRDTISVEPLTVELEDIGCSGHILATYTLGEESVSILGSSTAPLGDYTVFQEEAAPDFGGFVNYALIRTK